MVAATSWLLGIILAIVFAAAGGVKLAGRSVVNGSQTGLRLEPTHFALIGAAEVLAAVGVLAGLWRPLIWTGLMAAMALHLLMAGAVAYHVSAKDDFPEAIPAIVLGCLSFLYLTTRAMS